MIKIPTVLVLGAGASQPFDFPTGQGLKDHIVEKLHLPRFRQRLIDLDFDKSIIHDFRDSLRESGRPSVDAFLEYRDDFLGIGKASIAVALLPFERTTTLFGDWINKRRDPDKPGNWYEHLFGVLCDGIPFDVIDDNKLSIITFNYDRSLEHFLFMSLKKSYGITDKMCAEKLAKIPIIHVHGSLGSLPWQSNITGSIPPVPYDSNMLKEHVKSAAHNIKIIRENIVDTVEFTKARKKIQEAQQLLFLGFGFHPTNIKRLLPESLRIPMYVRGTSLGLSLERRIAIRQRHESLNEKDKKLIPKDVYTFLHDYVSFNKPGVDI